MSTQTTTSSQSAIEGFDSVLLTNVYEHAEMKEHLDVISFYKVYKKDFQRVLSLYNDLNMRFPYESTQVDLGIAGTYLALGEVDLSQEMFRDTVRAIPSRKHSETWSRYWMSRAFNMLGNCEYIKGNFDKACEIYEYAYRHVNPRYHLPLINLLLCYNEDLHDEDKSIQCYEELLLKPDFHSLMSTLDKDELDRLRQTSWFGDFEESSIYMTN